MASPAINRGSGGGRDQLRRFADSDSKSRRRRHFIDGDWCLRSGTWRTIADGCLKQLGGNGIATTPLPRLVSALRLHAVDMLRPRESPGANVGGIALDCSLDHRAEIAVAANELRRPPRQP